MDVATPSVHEPVLFQTARDPLGASYLGNTKLVFISLTFLNNICRLGGVVNVYRWTGRCGGRRVCAG